MEQVYSCPQTQSPVLVGKGSVDRCHINVDDHYQLDSDRLLKVVFFCFPLSFML